jgi:anti-anti-sigma factor
VIEPGDSARPRLHLVQNDPTNMQLAPALQAAPLHPAHGDARARTTADRTTVTFHGEIDIATVHLVASLLEAATAATHPHVLVDLTDVTFIDCSGLGQIARACRRARDRGGCLTLVCTSVRTLQVLRAAGLIPAIPVMMPEAIPLRPACCPS